MKKEGNLEAPTRHPIAWEEDTFWDEKNLFSELERVYDICHGCRRCVSLCDSLPTLFDLIDESETFEVDGVAKEDYYNVVDQCYLCDLCYMTKCPYVPPHDFDVDFPHLMLRAKAQRFKKDSASVRDKILTSTDTVGKLATIPVVDVSVNTLNDTKLFRNALESTLGVHHDAPLPKYHSKTLRKRFSSGEVVPNVVRQTTGKIALYATCYGNYNVPSLGEDFVKVFEHNEIQIDLVERESCCGMPKLELGDLDSVAKLKEANIPVLASMVDQGYDLVAPIPSCVLMYKQELPLLFPENQDLMKVSKSFRDPFEFLNMLNDEGILNTDFNTELGNISYQVACHQRVQNFGMLTKKILELVPGTTVDAIERCSGHDGTYGVKLETHDIAIKIARPITKSFKDANFDSFTSDCSLAAHHIENSLGNIQEPEHPISLIKKAYGIGA